MRTLVQNDRRGHLGRTAVRGAGIVRRYGEGETAVRRARGVSLEVAGGS